MNIFRFYLAGTLTLIIFLCTSPLQAQGTEPMLTRVSALTSPLCSEEGGMDERFYPSGELYLMAGCSDGKLSGTVETFYPDGGLW
ncbi:MAG: hypothetical protein KAJ18_02670 [Candidatus Omnitrophica bacterium]|nr:hypothetical protein [Candidatus Omnitrophota bacterium]